MSSSNLKTIVTGRRHFAGSARGHLDRTVRGTTKRHFHLIFIEQCGMGGAQRQWPFFESRAGPATRPRHPGSTVSRRSQRRCSAAKTYRIS
jgi:hypothetical protein